MKLAYIISKEVKPELFEENILLPLFAAEKNIHIQVIFFVGDGVYHLLKGASVAQDLKNILKKNELQIIACKNSIINRKLQNIIIDGIKIGTILDFFDLAENVDHILTF